MPRGRHRHSPSLHRLLPPAAVAVAGLACAGGAWLVGEAGFGDTDTVVLRGFATAAALAAVTGAALARRWDRGAGRRVGELKARLAGQEWRAEERQAELEADLEESRELRSGLETKLRDKRAELARLRTEHAALLRRYAHAESERASALEGRRLLEIEAAEPTRALTVGAADHRSASGAPTPLTYLQAREALRHLRQNAERQRAAGRQQAAEAERREPGPGTPAAPVPSRSDDGRPYRHPAGGFDFFGTARDAADDTDTAATAEPEREQEPVRGADREPDRGTPAGTDRAHPDAGAPQDAVPAARRPHPGHGPAGNVVDLSDETPPAPEGDADAVDITELRGAVP